MDTQPRYNAERQSDGSVNLTADDELIQVIPASKFAEYKTYLNAYVVANGGADNVLEVFAMMFGLELRPASAIIELAFRE